MDQTRLDNQAIYSEWTQQNAVHRYPKKKETSWISDFSRTDKMQEYAKQIARWTLSTFFRKKNICFHPETVPKNSFKESPRSYAS